MPGIAEDGCPIIIDLDSCWKIRESLERKKVGTTTDVSAGVADDEPAD